MLKRFFILAIICLLSASCALIKKQSICETITEPSYLCELADRNNVTLEMVGETLILFNSVAISEGYYSASQAIDVLTKLRDILENPVSYLFFRSQANKMLIRNPGLFKVANLYLDELNSTKIMYNVDRMILKNWIDNRIIELEGMQ